MIKTIDEIIDEVLIKNNINWLHTEERCKYQISEGRVPITRRDVKEIINKLPIIVYGENTSVDITPNGIVVKPTIPNN